MHTVYFFLKTLKFLSQESIPGWEPPTYTVVLADSFNKKNKVQHFIISNSVGR